MRCLLAIAVCLIAGGCQQGYYKVTDLSSNKEFYTKGWLPGMYGRYGSIRFQELRTGDYISLPSSRVHEVSAEEAAPLVDRRGQERRE